MTVGTIDESQREAAKVVGFSYLFALPPAIFAEFYVRTQLIAFDNAAQTARNIMAHERLFRLGIASNISVFAVDVILIIALYLVLMPVKRSLALLAMGWGLIETQSWSSPRSVTRASCRPWLGCRSARMTQRTESAWCSPGFEVRPFAFCGLSPASSQERWQGGEYWRLSCWA